MTSTTQKLKDVAEPESNGLNSLGGLPSGPVVVQIQAAPAPPGPRVEKNIQWIHIAEAGPYAEHQIRANIRYPDALNQALGAADFLVIRAALRRIVLEHNGWLDPETDEVMPPVSQPCQVDLDMAETIAAENASYALSLKEVTNDSANAGLDMAHTLKLQQIRADAAQRKTDSTTPCCFWDRVSQEEIVFMMMALGSERRKLTTFLLKTNAG